MSVDSPQSPVAARVDDPSDQPDIHLINDLCQYGLSNFCINTEILHNWQLELSGSACHHLLLAGAILQEVILLFPQTPLYFDRGNRDALVASLNRLNSLDCDVYFDFQFIVHELVRQAATSSNTGKIQLQRLRFVPALVDHVAGYIDAIPLELSRRQRQIASSKINLLVDFLELGCDVKQLKKLILPLFSKSTRVSAAKKRLYLELLYSVLEQYPSHFTFLVFNSFIGKSLPVPLASEFGLLKCLTLNCWLQINTVSVPESANDDIPVVTLFLLMDASNNDSTVLKIQLINFNQVMAEIQNKSTGSRMQFTFNQTLDSSSRNNQGYTYLTLTYDSYQNLNLFIDGDYSESIPCLQLSKTLSTWNKIYIGQPLDNETEYTAFHREELLIKDLSVLNIALPYEWVSTLYFLGIGFNWSNKEFSDENILTLINSLTPGQRVKLEFRFREIIEVQVQSHSTNSKYLHQSNLSGIRKQLSSKSESVDKRTIVSLLLKAKLKKTNILFDSSDASFLGYIERPQSADILVHESSLVHGSLYCLGGSALLLTLIEVVAKDSYDDEKDRDRLFIKSIDLLLICLLNSWRINKEFDNIDGYCLLALLIKFYKDTYNPTLAFDVETPATSASDSLSESSAVSSLSGQKSLFKILLEFTGCFLANSYESVIHNSNAYRFLILNFDIWAGTPDFALQQKHLQELMREGRHRAFNVKELAKMKLLKRLIQFIKLQCLDESRSGTDVTELSNTLASWIHADISVETIKTLSQFVIFALYGTQNEVARNFGLQALQALSDELCDPNSSIKSLKRFSRSITIHWILLLLSYQSRNEPEAKRVVCYGITLLVKLLRVLGPHIIKRFFHANKGLDVLTHNLQHWWSSDEVNALLFLGAFGADIPTSDFADLSLLKCVENKRLIQSANKLPMPDFMLLLNYMTLTGMYKLSLKHGKILSVPSSPVRGKRELPEDEIFEISFNALHLINQYSAMIEIGFADSPALQACFTSKEWLEGSIELLGYLKLSLTWSDNQLQKNFKDCFEKYISVISGIFISKLVNIKQLFAILNSLSEITKRIVLDSIFPTMFRHINQFIESSNFIFNERDFIHGSTELLNYYNKEFLMQNFYVESADLDSYIACIVFVMESYMSHSGNRKAILLDLGDILGNALVLKLSNINYPYYNDGEFDSSIEAKFARELDDNVKFIMYKQAVILHDDVLSTSSLRQIIELLMGNFLKLSVDNQLSIAEHLLNLLRTTFMMRQDSFADIVHQLTSISDYKNSADIMVGFFENLTNHNDEDTIKQLQKFPTIRQIFLKNYQFRISKLKDVGTIKAIEMISVMLNNGGSLGYMDNIYIKSFEKDCQRLKALTTNTELSKYNRELQDEQENNTFFISSFNTLKTEIIRILRDSQTQKDDYMLDYIEGVDRMRKLLVVENQLADAEKLTYNVAVPIKPIDELQTQSSNLDDYSFAFAYSGVNTLSLSDNPLLDTEFEDYEEIDEVPESESDAPNTATEDRNRRVLRSLYMGDQIQTLWNVSRIHGLDAVESLMILGFSHLYLTENYFHCPDGNVVEVHEAPIESRDPYLQLIKFQSNRGNATKTHRTRSWSLETLSSISKRKFLLRDCAIEMFFSDGASILITCLSTKQRDTIYNKLSPYSNGRGLDKDLAFCLDMSSNTFQQAQNSMGTGSYFTSKLASAFSGSFNSSSTFLAITKKWRIGEMSNFYYLMALNTLAGRTFNDLTQYPVFPWVIADYESETLDLSDPKSYRDLSKPMGAQTEGRAQQFAERYEALGSLGDDNSPPFHYGTHYSSAMIVTSYLIRLKPYVQSYLLLQGGKFDHADRLFNSVGKAWSSSSRDNTTDIRELIPEFFYLPEFLMNLNNFEFGKLQNGESTNDVILPKWANGDPKIFVAKNREALESPYVSANLHKWIDLIFGFKQSGPEAVKALNVFHHLSYDGAINLDNINDDVEKRAVIGMINNFGQTPMRLFTKPHPQKEVLNLPGMYLSLLDVEKNPPRTTFESKLKLPIEKLEISSKTKNTIGRPACTSSEDELLIRKPSNYQSKMGCGSLVINTTLFMNLHSANITSLLQIGNKQFVTGGSDGVVHVWKCTLKPTLAVSSQQVLRGHFSGIKTFCYSKTFKVCLSVDADGVIILWDFTRFNFVRRLPVPTTAEHSKVLVAISNDTGNICTVHSTKYSNLLSLYTINGEEILLATLAHGHISAIAIAGLNDTLLDSSKQDHLHSYWASEIVAVAYDLPHKNVQVYELTVNGQHWDFPLLQTVELASNVSGLITSMQLTKQVEVDAEEKLSRGHFRVVLGDSDGKVYCL